MGPYPDHHPVFPAEPVAPPRSAPSKQLPHWPAFNIADMNITFGVIILVIVIELGARRANRT